MLVQHVQNTDQGIEMPPLPPPMAELLETPNAQPSTPTTPKTRGISLPRAPGLPVGVDRDGSLLGMYKVATCPQVTFAYPGGIVQSAALLKRAPIATLRARVRELVAASRARGWRGGRSVNGPAGTPTRGRETGGRRARARERP